MGPSNGVFGGTSKARISYHISDFAYSGAVPLPGKAIIHVGVLQMTGGSEASKATLKNFLLIYLPSGCCGSDTHRKSSNDASTSELAQGVLVQAGHNVARK